MVNKLKKDYASQWQRVEKHFSWEEKWTFACLVLMFLKHFKNLMTNSLILLNKLWLWLTSFFILFLNIKSETKQPSEHSFNYFLTFAVGPVCVGLDPLPLQPVVAPLYPSCRPPGCKKCFCNDDIQYRLHIFGFGFYRSFRASTFSDSSFFRFLSSVLSSSLKYGDIIKINRNKEKTFSSTTFLRSLIWLYFPENLCKSKTISP